MVIFIQIQCEPSLFSSRWYIRVYSKLEKIYLLDHQRYFSSTKTKLCKQSNGGVPSKVFATRNEMPPSKGTLGVGEMGALHHLRCALETCPPAKPWNEGAVNSKWNMFCLPLLNFYLEHYSKDVHAVAGSGLGTCFCAEISQSTMRHCCS